MGLRRGPLDVKCAECPDLRARWGVSCEVRSLAAPWSLVERRLARGSGGSTRGWQLQLHGHLAVLGWRGGQSSKSACTRAQNVSQQWSRQGLFRVQGCFGGHRDIVRCRHAVGCTGSFQDVRVLLW